MINLLILIVVVYYIIFLAVTLLIFDLQILRIILLTAIPTVPISFIRFLPIAFYRGSSMFMPRRMPSNPLPHLVLDRMEIKAMHLWAFKKGVVGYSPSMVIMFLFGRALFMWDIEFYAKQKDMTMRLLLTGRTVFKATIMPYCIFAIWLLLYGEEIKCILLQVAKVMSL